MKRKYLVSIGLLLALTVAAKENKLPGYKNNPVGKILFSNQPFGNSNAGNKSNFGSNEYIYGRLELNGSTIKEAFKLEEIKGLPFLICAIEVRQDGKIVGSYSGTDNDYILLDPDNLDKSWLNLDILPEPARASTLYSMTDDFTAGYGYDPFYRIINPEFLPSAGTYQITVRIYSRSSDAWGRQEDREKWPFVEESFDFTFSEADIAMLKKNGKAAGDRMEANAFHYDKLPTVFSNPGKLTDPNATTAKVSAILKRDLPGRAIDRKSVV